MPKPTRRAYLRGSSNNEPSIYLVALASAACGWTVQANDSSDGGGGTRTRSTRSARDSSSVRLLTLSYATKVVASGEGSCQPPAGMVAGHHSLCAKVPLALKHRWQRTSVDQQPVEATLDWGHWPPTKVDNKLGACLPGSQDSHSRAGARRIANL